MKIILCHVRPPIPDPSNDWCVYEDGKEEDGSDGWGQTPLDALVDFANCTASERFDNTKSPLIAALKQALEVMDEPPCDNLVQRADQLDEQMHRIKGHIKDALRRLGEPS